MVFIPPFILLSCFAILNYNNLIVLLVNQHIYIIYILLLNIFYLNFTYLMRYQHMFMLSFINFFWFTLLNCFFCVNLLILSNYTDIFVIFFIFAVLQKLNFIILDFKALFFDFYFYFFLFCWCLQGSVAVSASPFRISGVGIPPRGLSRRLQLLS